MHLFLQGAARGVSVISASVLYGLIVVFVSRTVVAAGVLVAMVFIV